jgi:hypothetical protein
MTAGIGNCYKIRSDFRDTDLWACQPETGKHLFPQVPGMKVFLSAIT